MSQMNRRRALQLLAALGTTGLTAACATDGDEGPAAPTGKPVKIGLIAPQTGGFKAIGDEIVNGFQLYLTLNGQQLGGHPVTVVTADEGETAKTGKAAVDSLLKQGVLALTGVVNSAVMVGIRDTVEKARVPLVGSNASPKSLQSVVYIWRTSYVLDEPGRAIGPYMAQRLPTGSRVAIIAPDNLGSRDVIQGLQAQFSTAGTGDPRIADPVIWTDTSSTPGGTAYTADIRTALARQPDAIFCHFAGPAAVQFIKQLYREGWTGPIYAPGFLTEGTVLDEVQEVEARNIVTALNYSADLNNTANRTFASAYRKTHGASPTTYAMASYDAAQVLDKAIRLAGGDPTPQQVNLALGKIGQIDSPRGAWQFNQPRTPQQKWYLRKVQRDGQVLSNVLINELATLG
ncbi:MULTISPECIES: ABC transporter substrate-binding protein [Micromonospora]|uniref:ABC transporter substrate-binding protein n=1 Tax=Micromonospora TaxID=1873 RepID=UPI00098D0F33|nr:MULTISPECIES: ABC transporter substrate-binding protein [unclassified Micromonospora]OON33260.1 ABC transporter substrate-binding protein [Micromonospora sp. Rc5]